MRRWRFQRTAVVMAALMGWGYSLLATPGLSELYWQQLPDAVLMAAEENFHDGKPVDPSLLGTLANITIRDITTLSLSFVWETAGFRNSVGFYRMEEDGSILDETVVFPNFSGTGPGLAGGGDLIPGDTVDVGPFLPGERVGFFLIANGYQNPEGHRWYTEPELNADGHNHTAVVEIEDQGFLLGFEDLWNLGDRDYSDALLFVSAERVPGSGDARLESMSTFLIPAAYWIRAVDGDAYTFSGPHLEAVTSSGYAGLVETDVVRIAFAANTANRAVTFAYTPYVNMDAGREHTLPTHYLIDGTAVSSGHVVNPSRGATVFSTMLHVQRDGWNDPAGTYEATVTITVAAL